MTPANRRDLLVLGGAVLASAAVPGRAAQRPRDVTAPAEKLRTYMLMRGALDGRLVIGCLTGRYYGVVESEMKPLYGVVSATFARFRRASAGGYEGASYEVSYFTDLDSGKALEHFANPYTGQEVAVPRTNFPPARIILAPDASLTVPNPPPGLTMDHHLQPARALGDDVWMVEETFSTLAIPNLPKPVRYSEITTLHARRADLENPAAMRVPCQTAFQNVVSWRPWLAMGDRPGHLTANGFGRYGLALEELPANWLEAARAYRPEVLKDPSAPLDALLKT